MIIKGQLLNATNLNNAFLSKTTSTGQGINSTLTVSGGTLNLKNTSFDDTYNSGYLKIAPQNNSLILYDGVNNQSFSVYGSSGSDAIVLKTLTGSPSYSLITTTTDHLEVNTDNSKYVKFGGKVGLGIAPTQQLHVYAPNDLLFLQSSSGNSGNKVNINLLTYTGSYSPNAQISAVDDGSMGAHITFSNMTGAYNKALTERMRITSNGAVGIGTTSPAYTLDVSGDIHATTSYGVILNGQDAPLITRGWNAFTSGKYNGIGAWGLFMEPAQLTLGVNASNGTFAFAKYNADSTYSTVMHIDNNALVSINGNLPSQLTGFGNSTNLTVNGGFINQYDSYTYKVQKSVYASNADYSYYYLLLYTLPTGSSNMPGTAISGKVSAFRTDDIELNQSAEILVSSGWDNHVTTSVIQQNTNGGGIQVVNVAYNSGNYVGLLIDRTSGAGFAEWDLDLTISTTDVTQLNIMSLTTTGNVHSSIPNEYKAQTYITHDLNVNASATFNGGTHNYGGINAGGTSSFGYASSTSAQYNTGGGQNQVGLELRGNGTATGNGPAMVFHWENQNSIFLWNKSKGTLSLESPSGDAGNPANLNVQGAITAGGNIDAGSNRMNALSYKVNSQFTDLVNNAPWYGLGYTNLAVSSGYYTQLAGYWGLKLKSQGYELNLDSSVRTSNVTIDDGNVNMVIGGSNANGSSISLNNPNSNYLNFTNAGSGAPTVSGGGIGTKINLWVNNSSTHTNAIGIDSNTVWYASSTYHKWYTQSGGTGTPSNIMTLDGGGNLSANGSIESNNSLVTQASGDVSSVRTFRSTSYDYQLRWNDDGSNAQSNSAYPSWAMNVAVDYDYFGIWRSPSGNGTWTRLLEVTNSGNINVGNGVGLISSAGAKLVTGPQGGTWQTYAAASGNTSFVANAYDGTIAFQAGVNVSNPYGTTTYKNTMDDGLGRMTISSEGVLSATQGNLTIKHSTSGGYSSIVFPSAVNNGSDYGYIVYDDDNNNYNWWGDSAENSALIVGVQNDGQNSSSDVVALVSPAAVIADTPTFFVKTSNLGTTGGNTQDVASFKGSVSNNLQLIVRQVRTANGTDWTTADIELRRRTDATDQAVITLSHDGNVYINGVNPLKYQ